MTLNTELDSLWFSPVFANTIDLTPTQGLSIQVGLVFGKGGQANFSVHVEFFVKWLQCTI